MRVLIDLGYHSLMLHSSLSFFFVPITNSVTICSYCKDSEVMNEVPVVLLSQNLT